MSHSKPKPKHTVGRPTSYRAEMGRQIADAMTIGLSADAAAKVSVLSAACPSRWVSEPRDVASLFWAMVADAEGLLTETISLTDIASRGGEGA